MKRLCPILLTLVFAVTVRAFCSDNLMHKQYNISSGFNLTKINSIYEDPTGVIWISSGSGFYKFTGAELEKIDNKWAQNSMQSESQAYLTGDGKQRVFFNYGYNVIAFDIRTETFEYILDNTHDSPRGITNICYSHGKLFIGMPGKIMVAQDNIAKVLLTLPQEMVVSALYYSNDNSLYVGTSKMGLWQLDCNGNFKKILDVAQDIFSIYVDGRSNLWVGTRGDGVICRSAEGDTRRFFTSSSRDNSITGICEDKDGNIWLSNLCRLSPFGDNDWVVTNYQDNLKISPVSCIMADSKGRIWTGTYSWGLTCFDPKPGVFDHIDVAVGNGRLVTIQDMFIDTQNNIWAATNECGLIFVDAKSKKRVIYNSQNTPLKANNLKYIIYDRALDGLWLSVYMEGLYFFNLIDRSFQHFNINPLLVKNGDKFSEISNEAKDVGQSLIVGTYDGVYRFDKKSKTSLRLPIELKNIKNLIIAKDSTLWLSNYSNMVFSFNFDGKLLFTYKLPQSTTVTKIFEDNRERIWIGTTDTGLALIKSRNKNEFEFYDNNTLLENNAIRDIAQSGDGTLVLGTDVGVSFLNVDKQSCVNYNSSSGFPLISLKDGSIRSDEKGDIWLGGVNGVAKIRLDLVGGAEHQKTIFFSKLKVNDKSVGVNDKSGLISENIAFVKELKLRHSQGLFELQLSSDDYLNHNPNMFQYSLVGYDKGWYNLPSNGSIRYMNIPHGRYKLVVKHKTDPANIVELNINITPPWYLSWYAFLTYILVASGLSYWIISFIRLRNRVMIERKNKEQESLLNQWKLRFFTNIAHEFRMPLTIIIGQSDLLLNSPKITPTLTPYAQSINNHANKLKVLITELLEFRKQDLGFLKLHVRQVNIVQFIREIYNDFHEYVATKGIDLSFHTHNNQIMVWIDSTQLEKVIYNLVSNAIKHTAHGGAIRICVDIAQAGDVEIVEIIVSDSGVGIAEKDISGIFDRFYNVDTNVTDLGAGIGLSLAKGIVELHAGTMTVTSKEHIGSDFTVRLPLGRRHFENNPKIEITDEIALPHQPLKPLVTPMAQDINPNPKKFYKSLPSMLIVEDDMELREMLVEIFSALYNIYEAENGQTGYNIAKEVQPDIIISDILMPVMSGKEMCTRLKNEFETCHIPIILLTALTDETNNIEGLNCGADDYVHKPFNSKILVSKCASILYNRKMLQEKIILDPDTKIDTILKNPMDAEFMDKLTKLIENNIGNDKLNIQFLCTELGVSKTPLNTKIKGLVGLSPNEYIQSVRLKRAALLIKQNPWKKNIDIAEELGFSTADYFGYCFKKQFGVTPAAYRKK